VKKPAVTNNSAILNCQPEFKKGDIDPKEFFIFKNGMVWCNVFKSASTR
jgi:hypothetical protein